MGYSNETIQRDNTKTAEELTEFLEGKSFEDLFTGNTSQIGGFTLRETIFNTNDYRYVLLDDGQVLDMNHAIASADLGDWGNEVGWVVEQFQILQGSSSGGQQEDYFSNNFGEHLRGYIDQGLSVSEAFEKTVDDYNNGRLASVQLQDPSQIATVADYLEAHGQESSDGILTASLPAEAGSISLEPSGSLTIVNPDQRTIALGTIENGKFVSQDTQGVIGSLATLIEEHNNVELNARQNARQLEAIT